MRSAFPDDIESDVTAVQAAIRRFLSRDQDGSVMRILRAAEFPNPGAALASP